MVHQSVEIAKPLKDHLYPLMRYRNHSYMAMLCMDCRRFYR